MFTCESKCYKLSEDDVECMPYLTHEEADSKIIYRTQAEDTPVVVWAKDTDIFVLLVYARSQTNPQSPWILQIDKQQFVDIKKVYDYVGYEVASVLPQFHAITGSDSTSYKYNKGKIGALKKLLKDKSLCRYLRSLGVEATPTPESTNDSLKFIQCVIYTGDLNETNLESRIYKNLTKQSSDKIPPDEQSAIQDIHRCHFQVLIWTHCLKAHVPDYDPELYGWKFDETQKLLLPFWYAGPQLPPTQNTAMNSGTLADEPPAKKACLEESLDESDAASESDDALQSDDE